MIRTADVVICGAGIAGIAVAHALSVGHGVRDVVLVDERTPLSLTSDKSTEAYRNWWPGPDGSMVQFMNRSIDLLESWADRSDNRFLLNRRGYLYATAHADTAHRFVLDARVAESQGAGDVRVYASLASSSSYVPSTHRGYRGHPTGADLFLDKDAIRAHFPWLANDICAVMHTRRCGWLSGQQLGAMLLEEAKAAGTTVLHGRVERVTCTPGVDRVTVAGAGVDTAISTRAFVNAGGPFAREVAALVGTDLPVFSELHRKIAFEDTLGVIDRDSGLVILDDPQTLQWDDELRAELDANADTRWMTGELPAGIHFRPEGYHGSRTVLMLWHYHRSTQYDQPVFPLPDDVQYPELVLRGMTTLVPGLQPYVDRLPRVSVDGGYYTKTAENRPLVGPLDCAGAWVCAAFSGFGLMAAPAAGELLAAHVTGSGLPSYADAFLLSRYAQPAYRSLLAGWSATGQL